LFSADVIVLGAGPAGTATAIVCAEAGLRVVLIERRSFPRSAPGETLHPGVLPLLRRLGAEDDILAAGFLRHRGHFVRWDAPQQFVPFGEDGAGPWLGLQAWRPTFDALLLRRARRVGARILQPCRVERAIVEGGRVVGVETARGRIRAAYVIDATGRSRWLVRQLRLAVRTRGPRLTAWYGYVRGECPARDDAPALVADEGGWTWTARVRPRLYQWTRLTFRGGAPASDWLPPELRGLRPHGLRHGADVTWRLVGPLAGPGYFVVGDAAAVLDPASSHGVLRALMSGMLAAQAVVQALRPGADAARLAAGYSRWLRDGFENDAARLTELYARLPAGPGFVLTPNH
jgi:flavin-dependent dehydrogenase